MGSLSQPKLNIFTVGNMRVMICLGQGGLRSLSASSFSIILVLYKITSVVLHSCVIVLITSLAKEVMFLVALVS